MLARCCEPHMGDIVSQRRVLCDNVGVTASWALGTFLARACLRRHPRVGSLRSAESLCKMPLLLATSIVGFGGGDWRQETAPNASQCRTVSQCTRHSSRLRLSLPLGLRLAIIGLSYVPHFRFSLELVLSAMAIHLYGRLEVCFFSLSNPTVTAAHWRG